jgi:hypothetical protein
VVKAQNFSRAFLNIRHAQVELILRYWNSLEHAWWNQRKMHAMGKTGSAGSIDEKSKPSKQKKYD